MKTAVPDHQIMLEQAYPVLLDLMIRLVNSQMHKEIQTGEEWRNGAQSLAVKLFRHVVTMHDLAKGAEIVQGNEATYEHIDHSSINVIARAALETYLVWHYLYGREAGEQGKFRYLTWRLGGLMDRQGLKSISQQGREKQAAEFVEADALRDEIKGFPDFQSFRPNQQKRLLDGDWKIAMGTKRLAVAAGFHGTYFDNVYSYLCGYSHASYISALQIEQAVTRHDQERLAKATLGIGVVTLAHFVCTYPKHFPDAQAVLDANQNASAIARWWAIKAEHLNETYGTST